MEEESVPSSVPKNTTTKINTSAENERNMATNAVDEAKDTIIISKNKIKYINAKFTKVSAIMYDYKCDIKLKCGNANFKAHRDVLSAASDYFSAMFSHNMKEKEQDVIELKGISPAGFAVILDYFYHGFVTIEPKNIEDILEAARFFQVEWLVEVCCKFLVYHLGLDNYNDVLALSDKYFLGDLRWDIFRFLGNNLPELAKNASFFENLSLDLLTSFLKEDAYVDTTEDYLLYISHKWVKADLEKREQYLLPLVRLIRFPLMEPEGVEMMPDTFLKWPEIQDAVEEAKHYLNDIPAQCLHDELRFHARGSREVITAMTFYKEQNEVAHYDLEEKKLCYEQLGDVGLDIDFEYSSTAQICNFMFAVGGYGADYCSTKRMFRFDPRTRSWTELASMNNSRTSGAICSSGTQLFICGGVDHQYVDGDETEVILKTAEFYDPASNTWSPLPDLVQGTFSHALAYHENCLYASGGISADPSDPVPLTSCFKLQMGKEGWEPFRDMLNARQGHCMVPLDNKIYVIGGKCSGVGEGGKVTFPDSLKNEVYDIELNQWTELTPTPATFGSLSSFVAFHNRMIYFLGLIDGENKMVMKLNRYDIDKDEFEVVHELGGIYFKLGLFKVAFPPEYLQ